jgi:hypothetical protein
MIYFPERNITITHKPKVTYGVLKKNVTKKCTCVKCNVLTVLTTGLCSSTSQMSGSYLAHVSSIAVGSLLTNNSWGLKEGQDLVGCLPLSHTLSRGLTPCSPVSRHLLTLCMLCSVKACKFEPKHMRPIASDQYFFGYV